MINYQVIYQVNRATERLRKNSYHSMWSDKNHSRDSDMLSLFTLESQARQHSLDNLDRVLQVARQHDQNLVIVKSKMIQVVGAGSGQNTTVAKTLLPAQWLEDYAKWIDNSGSVGARFDTSNRGEAMEFWMYRPGVVLPRQQGVYDVTTGRRLTNRREIIQRIWDLGFASARGRPPHAARIRWTGTREELEEITVLADRYWSRRNTSEAAKKLVSAYRSINRYAAWPGAW